jgi:hypothetical protein
MESGFAVIAAVAAHMAKTPVMRDLMNFIGCSAIGLSGYCLVFNREISNIQLQNIEVRKITQIGSWVFPAFEIRDSLFYGSTFSAFNGMGTTRDII